MKHYIHWADVHLGVPVMDCYEYYDRIHTPEMKRLRQLPRIDGFFIAGDSLHKVFPDGDDNIKMLYKMLEEICLLSKMKGNFPIRIIRGTNGHDGNMLELFRALTRFGKVFKADTKSIENEIIKKIQNSKEYAINYHVTKDKSLFESLDKLMNTHLGNIENSEVGYNFEIYTKPIIENINGYKWLFVPEVYADNDEAISELFHQGPDFCLYHGMIEGAIDFYHDDKTSLIYNRSITMKRAYFNMVKYYTACGHIHQRVSLIPYIKPDNMMQKEKNMKLWYTGSMFAHNMSDAGLKKGYDIVSFDERDGTWVTEFIEVDSPKFITVNATAEFYKLDITTLTNLYLNKINNNNGAFMRLDIDLGYLDEQAKIKLEQFKARFPNLSYKIFNSKEEQAYEEQIKIEVEKLFTKSLKELTLELADGELTADDYDEFFGDMKEEDEEAEEDED